MSRASPISPHISPISPQVWSHVSGLTMFDPLTLLAAHPTTLERFFEVERKT